MSARAWTVTIVAAVVLGTVADNGDQEDQEPGGTGPTTPVVTGPPTGGRAVVADGDLTVTCDGGQVAAVEPDSAEARGRAAEMCVNLQAGVDGLGLDNLEEVKRRHGTDG